VAILKFSLRKTKNQTFFERHGLTVVTSCILLTWIVLYSVSDEKKHIGSFFGNAIADWTGVVVMILATKHLYERGSSESKEPKRKLPIRFLETLREHSLTVFLLITGIVWNLPASFVKDALMPTVSPVAALTGMQQAWEMYGPDPIARLENVQIPVTMSDGTERVWRWQPGDKVIGPFSWYRWQKLMEQVVRDPDSRAGLAHWAVRHVTSPGERPVHVEMVFRYQLLPAPGKDVIDDVSVTSLYSEDLNGRS